MSIPIDTLLNTVKSVVDGLGLTLNSTLIPSVVRKDGKRQAYDPNVLIIISKKPKEEVRTHFASGFDKVAFMIQVTLIAPNNDDQSTNLGPYATIRDTIEEKFRTRENANILGLPIASALRNVRSIPGSFLPVSSIMNNYDYQNIDVELEVISSRSQ